MVESIDSTGAGDAFVGATLYQLAREAEPKRVLEDFEQLKKSLPLVIKWERWSARM